VVVISECSVRNHSVRYTYQWEEDAQTEEQEHVGKEKNKMGFHLHRLCKVYTGHFNSNAHFFYSISTTVLMK